MPYEGKERRPNEGQWHLDKKFSIGIILAILIQSASFSWYAGKLDYEVQQDHSALQMLSAWREKQDDDRSKIDSHLAVLDEKITEETALLHRIDDIVEKPYRK